MDTEVEQKSFCESVDRSPFLDLAGYWLLVTVLAMSILVWLSLNNFLNSLCSRVAFFSLESYDFSFEF